MLKGAKYDSIRNAYRNYIVDLGKLAGLSDPEGRADRIIALETRLAKDQWTPERRRDPVKTHNPMTRAQLMKLAPQFDWTETLRVHWPGLGEEVDVAEPSAVAAAGKRIADVPLGTWKEYLTFRFISDHANYLPKAFDDARFGFYGHTLNDVPEQRARWKRGMRCSTTAWAKPSDSSTSRKYWPDRDRAHAQELVDDMRAAYAREDLERVVDGRRDPQGGARQARFVRPAHRPSGQMDRLFDARYQPQRSARQ